MIALNQTTTSTNFGSKQGANTTIFTADIITKSTMKHKTKQEKQARKKNAFAHIPHLAIDFVSFCFPVHNKHKLWFETITEGGRSSKTQKNRKTFVRKNAFSHIPLFAIDLCLVLLPPVLAVHCSQLME